MIKPDPKILNIARSTTGDPVMKFLLDSVTEAERTMRRAHEALTHHVIQKKKSAPKSLLGSLTPKQSEVLDFIVDFYYEKGYSPTTREITDFMGWSSENSAVTFIKVLTEKQYLHKSEDGKWRSVVPLFDSTKKPIKQK